MPAVARGWSSGAATCRISWSGVGVGWPDLDGNRLLLLNARREDGGSVLGPAPYLLAGLGDLVAEIA
jgi:hypothetical protein